MLIDKQEKIDRARELFLSGHSCAQSVAAAFAPQMGMDEKTVFRLAGGFGGGVGGMRVTCGTVLGMTMVLASLAGWDDPDDMERKRYLYGLVQQMGQRFTEQWGTTNCRELLIKAGVEVKSMPSERTPEYYRRRPCVKYVESCAAILADTINKEELYE